MFKGLYMSTSGMLTQSRVLNTISNNLSNSSTPGYKKDVMATTTFQDVLVHRTGNKDKSVYTPLGESSMIRTVDELVTNYEEGILEFTERPLDLAVAGKGFYQIVTADGENRYTRNGSFNVDSEGYLALQHMGRVMGENGEIYLGTDKINVAKDGVITNRDTKEELGQIRLVDFTDYAQLQKGDEGMFISPNQLNAVVASPDSVIMQGVIERSNVEASEEMISMIASQRAFQSSGQLVKAYDQLMAKAVELGAL